MSTFQEQNVDREKGRMLRIYIGLLLLLPSFTTTTTFLSFSSSITTITFLLFSFATTTITRFLYFLPPPLPPHFCHFLLPPPLPHFYHFPPSNSIKDCKLSQLVQFLAMSQVVNKNCYLFVKLISASFSYGQPLHDNYMH